MTIDSLDTCVTPPPSGMVGWGRSTRPWVSLARPKAKGSGIRPKSSADFGGVLLGGEFCVGSQPGGEGGVLDFGQVLGGMVHLRREGGRAWAGFQKRWRVWAR